MVLEILKKNQLSVTDSRKQILELFINSEGALAHSDIEKHTGDIFDRVTVYRTLQTFVDKGIFILYQLLIIQFFMRFVKRIVRQGITMITMFILYVMIVIKLFVWMKW